MKKLAGNEEENKLMIFPKGVYTVDEFVEMVKKTDFWKGDSPSNYNLSVLFKEVCNVVYGSPNEQRAYDYILTKFIEWRHSFINNDKKKIPRERIEVDWGITK